MTNTVEKITTPFIFNLSVNCYLVKTDQGYLLIDTGLPSGRKGIEQALETLGAQPDNLKLIVLTHGDIDHCGNAGYFREKFEVPIAMHDDDVGMVERGDMFWNRKDPNSLIRAIFGVLFGLKPADRFKPDLYLEDGSTLAEYGWNAKIIHIPGHSKGSIGILSPTGDLFCGDLLGNLTNPELWSIIDDWPAANTSVEKLKCLAIKTVYPGHGNPFPMAQFTQTHATSIAIPQ